MCRLGCKRESERNRESVRDSDREIKSVCERERKTECMREG